MIGPRARRSRRPQPNQGHGGSGLVPVKAWSAASQALKGKRSLAHAITKVLFGVGEESRLQ